MMPQDTATTLAVAALRQGKTEYIMMYYPAQDPDNILNGSPDRQTEKKRKRI